MYRLFITKDMNSQEFLINILDKYYQIKNPNIIYNDYGKPYLENYSNLYFNISHTKDILILAISTKEIGIDVEYFCYKPKLINKICTKDEIKKINEIDDKELYFTKMWVIKESYVKMIGKGLKYDFKKINTIELEEKTDLIYGDDYIIAVCIKSN